MSLLRKKTGDSPRWRIDPQIEREQISGCKRCAQAGYKQDPSRHRRARAPRSDE